MSHRASRTRVAKPDVSGQVVIPELDCTRNSCKLLSHLELKLGASLGWDH